MISKRMEVKKTIILEFSLPGVDPSWSSGGSGHERQLENRGMHQESWCLKINQDNALETAEVFAGLAKAIRESMEAK